MRWTGHIACMGRKLNVGFWRESQKERDHYKDLDDGIILKLILDK
jgi:hypothetical protein